MRKRPPIVPPPIAQERRYKRELDKIVEKVRDLTLAALIPTAQRVLADPAAPVKMDSAGDADVILSHLGAVRVQIERIVTAQATKQLSLAIFTDTSRYNLQGLQNQFRYVLGINPTLSEPYLAGAIDSFVATNASLIESIPTQALSQVEDEVRRAVMAGTRPEQLRSIIQTRFNVAGSRASLIARDQVGKLHGQLNQLRQTELGITRYIWITSNDERVRDTHAANQGVSFAWDSPPPETGHPGEDFQCRCAAQPDFSGFRGA